MEKKILFKQNNSALIENEYIDRTNHAYIRTR